jgi:hypothetical protein
MPRRLPHGGPASIGGNGLFGQIQPGIVPRPGAGRGLRRRRCPRLRGAAAVEGPVLSLFKTSASGRLIVALHQHGRLAAWFQVDPLVQRIDARRAPSFLDCLGDAVVIVQSNANVDGIVEPKCATNGVLAEAATATFDTGQWGIEP